MLYAHGHASAHRYPLWKVFEECEFVVERVNREDSTRAILFQLAGASLLSKKGGKAFEKMIKQLTGNS